MKILILILRLIAMTFVVLTCMNEIRRMAFVGGIVGNEHLWFLAIGAATAVSVVLVYWATCTVWSKLKRPPEWLCEIIGAGLVFLVICIGLKQAHDSGIVTNIKAPIVIAQVSYAVFDFGVLVAILTIISIFRAIIKWRRGY